MTRSRWPCVLLPWIASAAMPALTELAHDAVGAVLGAGEDQRPVDRLALRAAWQACPGLPAFSTRTARWSIFSTVVACGVTSTVTGSFSIWPASLADLVRHGGGEEQRLPLGRQQRDDLPDVVDEAHVEHAVGFVEHEHFDIVEADGAAVVEIEQAAGRGDQHVDAARQGADLLADRHAADDQRRRRRAGGGRRSRKLSTIWPPSSRVGASTSTRQLFG